jgi:hypothetical protein
MNPKTNTWAALVGSLAISEAIQRVAFSFGYKWPGYNSGEVVHTVYPVLFFNPDLKTILFGFDTKTVDDKACKLCITFDQVIELFKTPPVVKKELWVKVCDGTTTVHKDGFVLFGSGPRSVAVTSTEMEEVIEARNKLMGKEEKKKVLPVIQFRYSSPSSGERLRKLMVTDDQVDFYSGLDMDDNNQFKKFRKNRVVGTVMFVGFSETKDW